MLNVVFDKVLKVTYHLFVFVKLQLQKILLMVSFVPFPFFFSFLKVLNFQSGMIDGDLCICSSQFEL